ncbi:MAG: hypothetical protein A2820_00550, partial [Candidatus Buchananbacteria bacterium RIFCSPHIGHO2_01_FULL_40_35]
MGWLSWLKAPLSTGDEPRSSGVYPLTKRYFNMFYIYILQLKNNRLYIGFTSDLRNRYKQHQRGGVKSTQKLLPLKLIHYECYILEEDARGREKFLKTSDGRFFLNRQ